MATQQSSRKYCATRSSISAGDPQRLGEAAAWPREARPASSAAKPRFMSIISEAVEVARLSAEPHAFRRRGLTVSRSPSNRPLSARAWSRRERGGRVVGALGDDLARHRAAAWRPCGRRPCSRRWMPWRATAHSRRAVLRPEPPPRLVQARAWRPPDRSAARPGSPRRSRARRTSAGVPGPDASSSSSHRTPSVVARVIQYQPMELASSSPACVVARGPGIAGAPPDVVDLQVHPVEPLDAAGTGLVCRLSLAPGHGSSRRSAARRRPPRRPRAA